MLNAYQMGRFSKLTSPVCLVVFEWPIYFYKLLIIGELERCSGCGDGPTKPGISKKKATNYFIKFQKYEFYNALWAG